ncbi:Hypothetical protein R9X50_00060200 [Acrodontium crateriforme]|uniref:Zinc finger PHD-type domain-containing protein n=1 Tax=Acrodontium crateriforme TaxID=150365 RepID=A0AAQ3LXJ0_9PEZI|nr:Hypothetical protein R9X50_00060200 [Acrodontium crateriforme]
MAAVQEPQRPPTRTPGRSARNRSSTEVASEPPQKKRRYIPGGPGGGGRWLDADGNELQGSGHVPQTAPRVRPSRNQRQDGGNTDTPLVTRSAMQTRPRRERPSRYVPPPSTPRPRYSSAAAAAAASQASDGYKPREERSWEEFHPDLDIDTALLVFTADEVDGRQSTSGPKAALLQSAIMGSERKMSNGDADLKDAPIDGADDEGSQTVTPFRRRPGRPPRRPESMLSGLGSPPAPRINPLPTHNPKERLNLPKPSFRQFNHFLQYEEDQRENKVNYVDRTMAHVGYQESDRFALPPHVLIRSMESQQFEDDAEVSLRLESDVVDDSHQGPPAVGRVEYDMDEQDVAWLEDLNKERKTEGFDAIKPAIFEITMTQIEKEYHALEKRIPKPQPKHAQLTRPRSSSQAAVNGDPNPLNDEPDSKCAICDDGDCENANAIIFCDGCDLAVHQECYGVPFIPEGQWFCRKCKEIGRGTATCIFCPNVDGAFKQTNTLRWSHLLCAIWIPEVTIANITFMEPITDIDKVPKGRWKLNCYICNQKMGACIQCGNKNCYLAFHVTCARRAKLFLKMKTQNQAGLDTTALKAFCDKHVPPDWRRTHDTDNAIVEAKRWYRHAMKDRKWADSQMAAMELGAPPAPDGGLVGDTGAADDTIAVTKRRRSQGPKITWRLPSGAPVVPAAVFASVEAGLTRFTIRKRKEFVEKAAKYWTLKREARRGAALLKRLQLQLEGFTSMEITRRSFASMGAAGRPKLLRRIEFAEMLQKDMGHLTELSDQVKKREELRLKEIELLRELVNTVYFPIPALLLPILHKAQKADEKTRLFKEGFDELAVRLRERYYISVADFSRDLSHEIVKVLAASDNFGTSGDADIETIHTLLHEVKPGTAEHMTLTLEQKELKKLGKRIVKAVKEPLEDALKKEAELKGREHEEELRKLDSMPIFASSRVVELDDDDDKAGGKGRNGSDLSTITGNVEEDTDMLDAEGEEEEDVDVEGEPVANNESATASKAASYASSTQAKTMKTSSEKPTEPLSPPISNDASGTFAPSASAGTSTDLTDVFAHGGVPWYLAPFEPIGTTIHEEMYSGRAVLRDMSEELSDMDEDTLTELAVTAPERRRSTRGTPAKPLDAEQIPTATEEAKKPAPKRKRRR